MSDSGPAKMSSEEFKLRLQIESSLLVWMRTGLSLMGFGFVLARFGLFLHEMAAVGHVRLNAHPKLATMNTFSGTALMLLGVLVLIVSILNHRRFVTQLEQGDFKYPLRWSLAVILSLILAILGIGMAVFLTVVEL